MAAETTSMMTNIFAKKQYRFRLHKSSSCETLTGNVVTELAQ
jgi:hypothetical protein